MLCCCACVCVVVVYLNNRPVIKQVRKKETKTKEATNEGRQKPPIFARTSTSDKRIDEVKRSSIVAIINEE